MCSSSANHRICASGVRSSCDTPETNSVRMRASSCCRRSWMSVTMSRPAAIANSAIRSGSRDFGSPPTTSMLAKSSFRLTRMISRPKFGSSVSTAEYVRRRPARRLVDFVARERRDRDRQNRIDRQLADERRRQERARLAGRAAQVREDRREERLRIGHVAVDGRPADRAQRRARRRTRRASACRCAGRTASRTSRSSVPPRDS